MLNSAQIGENLRIWAKNNFGKYQNLAAELNMSSSSLQTYLNGESIPGGKILAKLAQLGCDLNWLLNGTTTNTVNETLEGYGMNYKTILEENKKLHDDLDRLKIKVFDLQEENEKLRLQLNDFEQVNSELLEELSELKKGLTPTN